jgi:hypothetical protein
MESAVTPEAAHGSQAFRSTPVRPRHAKLRGMRFLLILLMAFFAPLATAQDIDPAQRARIDDAISQFPPRASQMPRVFFVGFAGYGEERVFAEEIKLAATTVGARFGSTQRSLLLVNDRRDHDTFPIATHETLAYALASLSRVMDLERDVLFLALSSHGSRNGMIEVSDENLEPTDLSPKYLRAILDASGIRQRVIVVSACFSGAFIRTLANNDTILITAARRDRTSFGCSDQRHLTYFGEAFFRDALPHAPDLRIAFDETRRDISAREKEEKVTPSQPQSHFGPRLESALAAFPLRPAY